MQLQQALRYHTQWAIRKYASDADFAADKPFDLVVVDGNMMLNAGIAVALQLIGGIAATAFDTANARIGVGDSTAAEAAGQVALQAGANELFKAVSAGYPQVAGQSITWRAVFAGAEANFAWQEFAVDNGATLLNRKVSDQGTKAAGQTWTIDLTVTLS